MAHGALYYMMSKPDLDNRASESAVFNSDQKMALRAVYVVIC